MMETFPLAVRAKGSLILDRLNIFILHLYSARLDVYTGRLESLIFPVSSINQRSSLCRGSRSLHSLSHSPFVLHNDAENSRNKNIADLHAGSLRHKRCLI